nr:nitroreductase family protein [Bifidobacterium callitrichos]
MGRMEHTQLIDAVNIRTAIRSYDADPIDDDVARQLSMTLDPINLISGLDIQLVRDQPKVFAAANESGHLKNAANYLAIVGPKDDDEAKERAGFYAERVVLTATLRGLGTLWVGGSWDREEAARHCRIARDQELYLAVVIGYPEHHLERLQRGYDELVEYQRKHRPTKTYEQFTAGMSDEERAAAPEWFRAGVEAAMKAPSAMNRQPVVFSYNPTDGTAAARIDPTAGDEHCAANDLGIAKLHFQIGAGQGQWAWGDGGLFLHR